MKGPFLLAAAVFVGVGCGSLTPGVSGSYKLYAAAANSTAVQVAVIDSRSHSIERKLEMGTPSRNWNHFYSVISNSLLDINPNTGSALRTLQLPRHYELPNATITGIPGGLSQNGKWLVLQSFDRGTSTPTASHLLLVDTSFGWTPVPIELKGWFDFDAISNDGENLFLIQYIAPQLYHVRLYHVAQHQLDPTVIVEKGASPKSPMAGMKLMSVPSPDGEWLYTLYARANAGAFIHGLKMDGTPFAACIDLPGDGYSKNPYELQWSLAMNPGRSVLYAANGALGMLGEVSIGGSEWPSLKRTSHIGAVQSASSFLVEDVAAKEFATNAAAVSADGKTLVTSSGTGIVWLDTNSLHTRTQALVGWRIWSLALTPDGRALYALSDSGHIAELSMASGSVVAEFNPAAGYTIAIMRVAAA